MIIILDFLFPSRCPEFHLSVVPDCDGGEAVVGVDQALDHTGVGEAEERSDDDKTKNFRLRLSDEV